MEYTKDGRTFEMFAASIGVHRDTLYDWAAKYPEFLYSMKLAKQNAEVYMQKIGLAGMTGKLKGFQSIQWIFYMKTRFGWTEQPNSDPLDAEDVEFVDG